MNKILEDTIKLSPPVKKIYALNGDDIDLPMVTLKIELGVMRAFFEFLEAGGLQDADLSSTGIRDIIINSFTSDAGNEKLLSMFELIIGKPSQWLLENIDLKALISVVTPFFVERIEALTEVLENLFDSESSPITSAIDISGQSKSS